MREVGAVAIATVVTLTCIAAISHGLVALVGFFKRRALMRRTLTCPFCERTAKGSDGFRLLPFANYFWCEDKAACQKRAWHT